MRDQIFNHKESKSESISLRMIINCIDKLLDLSKYYEINSLKKLANENYQ